ncbi:glycosyl hydrolase [Nonomuraea sp. NPDC046570]|uniref:glycosyl hydrolase n=1 Tax=Nonomuraea sp. NPDC046570 TaxID=3155255 RepID=UPI0033CA50E9
MISPLTRRVLAALISVALMWSCSATAASADTRLPYSNTFDAWSISRNGSAEVAFTATTQGHTGSAVRIVNQTPSSPNTFGQLAQTVPVKPATPYRFTAWVASEGLSRAAALQAVLSPDTSRRYNFPTGVYDWRQVSWSYTTLATQTSFSLRIVSQDVTPGVRLDDLTMTEEGSERNLLVNSGFEQHSTYFGVMNDSLLFDPGTAALDLFTDARNPAPAGWAVRDVRGTQVASGTAAFTDGRSVVNLASLPNGYYTFVSDTLSASFGIVPPMPAAAADSPFGVGLHGYERELIDGIARIGYTRSRNDVAWSVVEKQPGVYTFPARYTDGFAALNAAGIEPLPISSYRNPLYDDNRTPSSPEGLAAYGRFTAAVNQQFKGYTQATEVYNEFNINFNDGLCGRTPACYAQLLQAAADKVDAQSPQAQLVGPAISGASADYVRQVLELGGAAVLDAVSVHPYRHPSPPEGMDTQMAALSQTIDDAAGRSLPLWLTEYGWPTHIAGGTSDAMQADYLVRSAVLSLAGGADRLYWYDARDDGTDPNNQEHNFGVFEVRRATARYAAEPKPAAVAQAVMAAELAGRKLTKRDTLDATTYSFAFKSAVNDINRVMWASNGPKTVTLRTDRPLTLTDQYGVRTTLSPHAGAVEVTLTEHPIYVRGDVDTLTVNPAPAIALQTSATVADGESIEVRAVVDRTGKNCRALPAKVTIALEGQRRDVRVRGCGTGEAMFDIPTTAGGKASWLTGWASAGKEKVARLATPTIRITTPVVATTQAKLVRDGGYRAEAVVFLSNTSRKTAVTLDGIAWTLGQQSGTIADSTTLQPGKQVEHTIPLPSLRVWEQGYLDVSVGLADRADLSLRQSVGAGPIEPDTATTVAPIDLSTDAKWFRYTADWGGAADLGGPVKITETATGLRVQATVQDDVFTQKNPAGNLYNGDSVQLSLSPALPGASTERTEIGLALTPGGPAAYTFAAFGIAITGPTPTERLTVTRTGTTTAYDVVLPWQSLGLNGPPAEMFALSLLVNDDDGPGRKGYLEWSSGIGHSKDTGRHFPVRLTSGL